MLSLLGANLRLAVAALPMKVHPKIQFAQSRYQNKFHSFEPARHDQVRKTRPLQ